MVHANNAKPNRCSVRRSILHRLVRVLQNKRYLKIDIFLNSILIQNHLKKERTQYYLIKEGLLKLVQVLAGSLNIKLGTNVTAIRSTDRGVLVQTSQHTFRSKKIIVTVPLGILQREFGSVSME